MSKRKADNNDESINPLWKYVEKQGRSPSGGGNLHILCSFCKESFQGSYTRVKAHLLGQKGCGVRSCNSVDVDTRKKLLKLQEVGDIRGQMISSGLADISYPEEDSYGIKLRKGDTSRLGEMFNLTARDQLDHMIARFFYGCGISFNVARSPLFRDMIQFAADNSLKGFLPPSADKLRTKLLDEEHANIDKLLQPIKNNWKRTGVSIASDGWTDNNSRPLINFMGVTGNGPVFLKAVDASGNFKDANYLAKLFLDTIADVGPSSVVQIITDNAPVLKAAVTMVESVHKHIFWTPCVAHTLNLALKDLCDPNPRDLTRFAECNWIKELITQARMVKMFVANHSHALTIYKKYATLMLLSIAETRFASNLIMIRRLVEVKPALLAMVVDEDWKFYKADDNKKAQVIKNTIVDDSWWEKASYLLDVTMPIIDVLRVSDTDKPTLHLIYDMWDAMIEQVRLVIFKYENRDVAIDSSPFYTEVHDILVKRWNKSNTPLICLAHSLNPKYYSDKWLDSGNGLSRVPPHRDEELSNGRNECFERLFDNPEERSKVKEQYGKFSGCLESFGNWESMRDRFTDDASTWWNNYGASATMLATLADRLMNQPCSACCCERNWSTYALILDTSRNRLQSKRAADLVYVHNSLRLLSRKEESYLKGPTKFWDVLIDETNMEGSSELQMSNLGLDEPVAFPSPFEEDLTGH